LQFVWFQAFATLKRQQRLRLVFDDALARTLADEATAAEPALDARRLALATCLQKLPPDLTASQAADLRSHLESLR